MGKLKKIFRSKLVQSGGWYTVTEFFIKGMSFLTIPIFTRILSPSDYGLQSLYTTWANIISIVCCLNLHSSIIKARFDFEDDFDGYVSSISFLSMIMFTIFLVIMTIFRSFFAPLFGFDGLLYYLLLFYSFSIFTTNVMLTKLRVTYKYKGVSILNVAIKLLGLATAIALILTYFRDRGYLGKILGDSSFTILFGIFFLLYLINSGKCLINIEYWKYAIIYSLPLVFHSLANIINNQFDRIIIENYHGTYQTGLYSFAYSFGTAIFVIIHALDLAWSPWAFEQLKEKNYDKIRKLSFLYRDIINISLALIMILAPEFVKIMSSERYWVALNVIPWVLLGYYFNFMYTLEVKVEFFHKKTIIVSIGTIMSACLNLILNYIFVPNYGYIAAAITTTFSYLALFFFHYIMVVFVMKKKLYKFSFHLQSLIYGFIVTIVYFLTSENLLFRMSVLVLILIYNFSSVYKNYKKLK